MSSSFFEPLGDDRWRATVHTTGPWDERFQHGGPPSALLGRAVEHCSPRDDMVVARLTVEILGAVPVGELTLQARVLRPGRSVELVESVPSRAPAPPPMPDSSTPVTPAGWVDGYLSAIEWRFVAGYFGEPGPCTAWSRMTVPLVPDEEPSPLTRVLAVADSGNGLSSELDMTRWHFINPELTVHLHREPVGEWVCVDARTTISPGGAGLATTALSDLDGPVGVGAQSLLVAPR